MKRDELVSKINELKERMKKSTNRKYTLFYFLYQALVILLSFFAGFRDFFNPIIGRIASYPYSGINVYDLLGRDLTLISTLNGGNMFFTYNKRNPFKSFWFRFLSIAIVLIISINIYLVKIGSPLSITKTVYVSAVVPEYGVFARKRDELSDKTQ